MNVVWTQHAEGRQQEWFATRGITRSQVEEAVRNPEQVVAGHDGLFVAQTRTQSGLLRVPFFEVDENRIVVTVYWTSQMHRYWEE